MYEGCKPMCKSNCFKKCVGEIKFRVYESCCYNVVMVCPHCGCEYRHDHRPQCPRCGMPHGMHHGMPHPGQYM
ncbi:MAG: hypothetical protein H6Q74_1532 [Firmicutes bacterium]|nr:hypothetical protein [Bacillota bacterium]